MSALEDRSACSYLSLEYYDDEAKAKKYEEEHIIASRKVFAIQDAFAEAIGKDAIKKLAEINELNPLDFSRDGREIGSNIRIKK